MYCHDLEVLSSNPGWIEIGVRSTSVQSRSLLEPNYKGFHIYERMAPMHQQRKYVSCADYDGEFNTNTVYLNMFITL